MKAQYFYNKVTELKEVIKESYEKLNELYDTFYKENEDFELPIKDKDGKDKFIRVFEPEGFFVYNRKYEVGLRSKPKKVKEALK